MDSLALLRTQEGFPANNTAKTKVGAIQAY